MVERAKWNALEHSLQPESLKQNVISGEITTVSVAIKVLKDAKGMIPLTTSVCLFGLSRK